MPVKKTGPRPLVACAKYFFALCTLAGRTHSKAVGDPLGEVELMTCFVECGNNCTLDLGDIDEGFYDALNRMYRRTIEKVIGLPEAQQLIYKERLKEIMTSSSHIGWGYHDMLFADYYAAFSDDE